MKNTTDIQTKYTFFWGGPFSQWSPSKFVIDNIAFADAEMYMMYKKAMLFNDTVTAEKILLAKHPSESQALGFKVKNFDKTLWEQHCKQIVYDGNYAKFTQNEILLEHLMATADTELVEASPEDKIWGIGLSEDNPLAQNKETWQGTNWLGEVLTKLREDLKKEMTNKYVSDAPQKPFITFDDYNKLDIRLCKILSVEKVPNTDKLYKMEINTGIDKRTVVSAIAHIIPDTRYLINNYYFFVLNLEPRKIKGIESTAMIIMSENKNLNLMFAVFPSFLDHSSAQTRAIDKMEREIGMDKMLIGSVMI